MMFTPCGPSAVPTGGAGVAAPAFSCTLTTAGIFFFLGAIPGSLPHCRVLLGGTGLHRGTPGGYGCPVRWLLGSDLADLIERQLDRSLPAEDRDEHLELLGVGVDLVHRGRQRREWPVHNGNGLADLEVHRSRAQCLGLLRGL